MSDYLNVLARLGGASRVPITAELDEALAALDAEFEHLAPAMEVEYIGPGVGVEGKETVYRLVVRAHEWTIHQPSWSLKICDALPNAGWRAAWAVQGASRARKALTVNVLGEFLDGYATAIKAADKAGTEAGQRVLAMAKHYRDAAAG